MRRILLILDEINILFLVSEHIRYYLNKLSPKYQPYPKSIKIEIIQTKKSLSHKIGDEFMTAPLCRKFRENKGKRFW